MIYGMINWVVIAMLLSNATHLPCQMGILNLSINGQNRYNIRQYSNSMLAAGEVRSILRLLRLLGLGLRLGFLG